MYLSQLLQFLVAKRHILKWLMLAVMTMLVVLDLLISSKYERFPWDSIGGFGAFYGVASCILIVVVSKVLGYVLLYRSEDYYDD